MNDRQREQARIRQARRRARLKEEGASVTVTLTKQEEAMLQELCRVRRPGRTTHASVGVELPVSAAFPCLPAGPRSWGGCWASFTASLPRTWSRKRAIPTKWPRRARSP